MKLLVTIWLSFISRSLQQGFYQDSNVCSTPRNEIGSCIPIRECSYLYNLLERERGNQRVAQYVRNSECGYEGRLPKVCCPQNTLNKPTSAPLIDTTRRPDIRNRFSKLPQAAFNECGTNSQNTSRRVVGGMPSELGQWPWMAAVGFKIRGRRAPKTPDWMCGGALITRRYVLTAAHCVSKETTGEYEPYIVHVGGIDLKNERVGANYEVERSIIHQGYSSQTKLNDIALFRLKQDVVLDENTKLVCVPTEEQLRSNLFENKTPFVAGWGSTVFSGPLSPILRHVQISVVPNPTCRKIFENLGATINDDILCAGVLRGGKDSCGGDSGGPLMFPVGNQYYIIGVVSYGKKCAEPGFPGVYTRVTRYVDWITDNIQP